MHSRITISPHLLARPLLSSQEAHLSVKSCAASLLGTCIHLVQRGDDPEQACKHQDLIMSCAQVSFVGSSEYGRWTLPYGNRGRRCLYFMALLGTGWKPSEFPQFRTSCIRSKEGHCRTRTDSRQLSLLHHHVCHTHGLSSSPTCLYGNCLVDMYARCGRLGDAREIFDILVTMDVVTWNVQFV